MAKFEEDNYNKKNFAELKINVHKALKVLKQNRFFWITRR